MRDDITGVLTSVLPAPKLTETATQTRRRARTNARRQSGTPSRTPQRHDGGGGRGAKAGDDDGGDGGDGGDGDRAPPSRLISKGEVLDRIGVTYVTIWKWMREGKFPRSRVPDDSVGEGRIFWLEAEIEAWIKGLPVRRLKGDAA